MKGRRWTEEEDQLLRQVVLKTISEGGTQLHAFAEVGKKIGRTAGACGFRWNAVLRKQDPQSYSEAKRKRVYAQLQKKRKPEIDSFASVYVICKQLEKDWERLKERVAKLSHEVALRKEKIIALTEENRNLIKESNSYGWVQQEMKERYQDILKLLHKLKEDEPKIAKYWQETEINNDADSDASS